MGTVWWAHRVELAAEAANVPRARIFVRSRLLEHELAEIDGDVQLVVSELATNALNHARTPFAVTIRREGSEVVLTVQDGSSVRPAVVKVKVEATAAGGRGLSIVDAVSHRWGTVEHPGAGKSVWASFLVPAQAGPG
jgi:anti-sigma regulatory factor (Ser/Thr protein kinase)